MSDDSLQGFAIIRNLIRWQNRPDGTFIQVLPDAQPIAEQDLFHVFLDAGVINANAATIAGHIREKSQGWQRVGKAFEIKDSVPKVLDVRIHEMAASLWIDPPQAVEEGRIVTSEEVKELLKFYHVIHGIDSDFIQNLLRPDCPAGWYDVAICEPAIEGTDAIIECMVNVDQTSIPIPGNDGMVDFRDRGDLPEVTEGTAIYVKTPLVPAQDGIDMAGNPIKAKTSRDAALIPSENIRFREGDPNVLEASCDGYLFKGRDGRVQIGRIFNVKGDLDLKIGNIKYHGPISIGGNVPSGFRIYGGGDITIGGTAEGADIQSTGGSVVIRGGVFGGKIYAANDVKVAFAHEVNIYAGGMIDGGKYLQHCQSRCAVLKFVRGGMIVGGQVLVSRELDCDVLGTEAGSPTIINLSDPEEEDARKELERTNLEEKKLIPLRDLLEQKVVVLKSRISGGAQLLGRARDDAEETLRQYGGIVEKMKELAARRARCKEILDAEREREGAIIVRKAMFTGVDMHIFGRRFEITDVRPPVKIAVRDREVEAQKI